MNVKGFFEKISDFFIFVLTGKGKYANEMIEKDIIDYSGQGRDRYGR